MISNKDLRVEDGNLIINGEKHPLDPAVEALTKRANTVQGKLSALDAKLDAIEALEKTASGNPISLTGAAAAYAMGLSMTIEPVQSGSGDPSPTNVRPISGISTASVQTTDGTHSNTATITLGQTVYGGSVNFKTGEVTVTHGIVDLGDLGWVYDNQFGYDMFYTEPSLDNKALNWNFLCDCFKTVASSRDHLNNFEIGTYNLFAERKRFAIRYDGITTTSAFITAVTGHMACYELATPTTLTLTPAELELLKGANTISGNGANINISYIGR